MSDDTTNDDTNDTTNDTVVGQLARTRTLARTMTEVIKLRRWKEEAETVILGLQELGQTLGVPLGANVTGKTATDAAAALVAERDHYHARLDALLATMGETLPEGEKPGAYWAKWHMKHCVAAEAAQQLAAERDAAKEAAALAEKDRRAYHRDALATIKERDELQATVAAREELISDLTDPDPCWFDHNGGCQAHGYLSLDPGETCPQYDAQQIVAAQQFRGEQP